jgi:predicted ABC-type ATPase
VSTPLLHVLAGPNGSGKSTFVREVLGPVTRLPFVNADEIAERRSFITETVFSHPSKVDLIGRAVAAGYLVELHVMLVPEELAVARVAHRVALGGHTVPEDKVRQRYRRLWELVVQARPLVDRAMFYDNTTSARPFRTVATYERGRLVGTPAWPAWTPLPLTALRAHARSARARGRP